LDLTSKDIDLLDNLQSLNRETFSKRQNNIFDRLILKIMKFSNKHILRVEKKTFHMSHELFNKAIEEQRKIRLMYRIKAVLECVPLGIIEYKGRVFYNVLSKNKEKLICEDRITGIELTNQKFSVNNQVPKVIFALKGDLAKRYSARENEEVMKNSADKTLIVTNTGENKEILLSRLMRYDSSCEIISPESYRQEMKQIVINTLCNYGETM